MTRALAVCALDWNTGARILRSVLHDHSSIYDSQILPALHGGVNPGLRAVEGEA